MFTLQIQYLDDNLNRGRPLDEFYVSQAILTPDAKAIASHLLGTLYDWEKPMLPMVDLWVEQQSIDVTHGMNIVIRDFVDDSYTKTLINKNLE